MDGSARFSVLFFAPAFRRWVAAGRFFISARFSAASRRGLSHWAANRAFTLIELLIVVSIIIILNGGMLTLSIGFGRNEERIRTALEIEESAARLRAAWRADLLAASQVRLERPAGTAALTIRRGAPGGREISVVYQLARGGVVERAAGGGKPEVLARGVTALDFTPVGSGWRVDWTVSDNDGVWRRSWRQSALATPLAPAAEAQR